MNLSALAREAWRRDRVLTATAWLHVALFLVLAAYAPFDSRTVLGLNPWIKPIKFCVLPAVPLFGFLVASRFAGWRERRQAVAVFAFAAAYAGLGVALYLGAMSGTPLFQAALLAGHSRIFSAT